MITRTLVALQVPVSTLHGVKISGFNGVMLLMDKHVLIDNVVSVVSSSISRVCQPVFEDACRGRVCVGTFVGVSVRVL